MIDFIKTVFIASRGYALPKALRKRDLIAGCVASIT